jgi:hypothetical protein
MSSLGGFVGVISFGGRRRGVLNVVSLSFGGLVFIAIHLQEGEGQRREGRG